MFSSNQMIILLRNTTPWYSMVLYKRKINLLVLYNLGQVGVSVFFEFSKCSSEVQPIKSYQNSNYSKLLEKVQLELLNDSNKLNQFFRLIQSYTCSLTFTLYTCSNRRFTEIERSHGHRAQIMKFQL